MEKGFFLYRWFKNVSISRKLYFTVGTMAVLIGVELFVLFFSLSTLSSLRAYVGGEGLMLDNQISRVVPVSQIHHYRPYYSTNETGWWLHVPNPLGIEAPVRRRQPIGEPVDDVHRHRRRAGALGRGRPGGGIGLHREHRLDAGRVELERAPLAAADLDHPAAQTGEQPPPQLPGNHVRAPLLAPLKEAREPRLAGAVEGRVSLAGAASGTG